MGKSTVGTMMRGMNIPVHEADIAVHQLLKPKGEARPAVAAAFPFYEYPEIYDRKTKEINRAAFGALIFNNDDYRALLESILHPLVRKKQNEFIREYTLKGFDMVCLDIPLLFETGAQTRVDYTITVSAPPFIQKSRVLDRANMDEAKFYAILGRQMPDVRKCALSHYVIKSGLGRAHAMRMLKTIITEIRETHFQNDHLGEIPEEIYS